MTRSWLGSIAGHQDSFGCRGACDSQACSKQRYQTGLCCLQEPSPYQLGVLLGIEAELMRPPKVGRPLLYGLVINFVLGRQHILQVSVSKRRVSMQEWSDYLFPMGKGDDTLSEELDGLDAEEALT